MGVLARMTHVQHHRGPDDTGFAGFSMSRAKVEMLEGPMEGLHRGMSGGIGFNRLSIIDLSINGRQPMVSQNGQVLLAYNGETYNASQFRGELENKGYRFRSLTDSEVVLHLYQEHGIDGMLERMEGMFAFSIVDLAKQKLYLARDHAGIKPMYWCSIDGSLLFASEVKAFLEHPGFAPEIDEEHLDEYLLANHNGHDRTLYKGVRRVPPGHYMEVDASGERLVRYWKPCLDDRTDVSGAGADVLARVFEESVKAHLVSDVKLGCQLSGGVDSSLISLFASKHLGSRLHTFSIGYENADFSEDHYIDQVVEKIDSVAHRTELNSELFCRELTKTAWHMDEPLPLPQCIGFRLLAKMASREVVVLLGGEGADELMGGYKHLFCVAHRMRHPLATRLMARRKRKAALRFMMDYPLEHHMLLSRLGTRIPYWHQLRPEGDLEAVLDQARTMMPRHADPLKAIRLYDMRGWLAHVLNIQDKMAMSQSIENRVPIIGRKMTEFVFSLPSHCFLKGAMNPFNGKSSNAYTKILFKQVARHHFGRDFAYRDKVGFIQPLGDYLASSQMRELLEDLIMPGMQQRGLLDVKRVRALAEHPGGGGNYLFWNCITLELWAQMFIDRTLSP